MATVPEDAPLKATPVTGDRLLGFNSEDGDSLATFELPSESGLGYSNVKSAAFGAIGNGVADDTAAFVLACSTGGTIWIPDGNYLLSTSASLPLNPIDGTIFIFESRNAKIHNLNDKATFKIKGKTGVEFHGGQIVGSNTLTHQENRGIWISDSDDTMNISSYCKIIRTHFYQISNLAVRVDDSSVRNYIDVSTEDCNVETTTAFGSDYGDVALFSSSNYNEIILRSDNGGRAGVSIYSSNYNQIHDSYLSTDTGSSFSSGLYILEGSTGNQISNVTIDGCRYEGITCFGGYNYFNGIIVRNSQYAGIAFYDKETSPYTQIVGGLLNNFVIEGNSAMTHGIIVRHGKNITISNGIIKDLTKTTSTGAYGLSIFRRNALEVNQNINITNVEITNCTQNRIEFCEDSNISINTHNNLRDGVLIRASNSNRFNIIATDNDTADSSTYVGIKVGDTVSGDECTYNVFSGCAASGATQTYGMGFYRAGSIGNIVVGGNFFGNKTGDWSFNSSFDERLNLLSSSQNWMHSQVNGRKTSWASGSPSTGSAVSGDIVWSTDPSNVSNARTLGWVCTTTGSPGTWTPIGAIDDTKYKSALTQTTAGSISSCVTAKYAITHIFIENTTANAITGGLKIGTTAGATDVVAAQAVGANALIVISDASILKRLFNTGSTAQTIYFDAVTSWNSASINIYFKMQRMIY